MSSGRMRWAAVLVGCVVVLFSLGACGGDDDDDSGDDGSDDDDAGDDDDSGDDDAGDDDDDDTPEYPNDGRLRVNDLQALGTHNSYHVEPPFLVVPSYNYTHKPLDEQADLGVRQFELDIHWIPGAGVKVFHAPIIDQVSTCDTLVECLGALKGWSDAHPGHHPLLVFLEPKDDLGVSQIAEHALDVEDDILSVWPRERILTPDDVRGEYETLREAITEGGWPTMGEARNKILFHAHSEDAFLANYHELYPDLVDAVMFTDSTPDDSYAAVMPINDPVGRADEIRAAVEQGFLVRTMAGGCCEQPEANDYARVEAALASGAHFISTDFPSADNEWGYVVSIPDGMPSRCNPLVAPEFCTPADVEDLPE